MTLTRSKALLNLSKAALDAVLAAVAFVLGYYLRETLPIPAPSVGLGPFSDFIPMMVVQVISVLAVFYFTKLYHQARAVSRVDELTTIFGSVSIATMMTVAISALTWRNTPFELDFPRGMILYAWELAIILIVLGREAHRRVWHRLRMRGVGRDRVLVVGSGEAAQAIIQKIQWSPYLGYDLVGVVNGSEGAEEVSGAPVLGEKDNLAEIIESNEINEVIIALPEGTSRQEVIRLVSLCQRGSVAIKIFPDVFEFITTGVSIDDLGGLPLLSVRDIQLRGYRRSLKRAIDMLGAGIGLVLLSPYFMLIALIIKLESPGPVFYTQERMGLDGRTFNMIKFRSMHKDADKGGRGWTTKDDPRRTRLGSWLRQRDIDELPQLINVFLGEMSLVGPRPEQPTYVEKFRDHIPRYMDRHREKGGMTGWAQIHGYRGDTSISERIKYDLWYVENWSLWLDIKILVRTVFSTVLALVGIRNENSNAY
ncbi:MAG: undecaprenyl-phosphate glucose phosphotransferase [Chloroflexi bacterium]|nr:undecaprenyl-phosphate glucose phosphotransferase [Chloroflexota bacterium]